PGPPDRSARGRGASRGRVADVTPLDVLGVAGVAPLLLSLHREGEDECQHADDHEDVADRVDVEDLPRVGAEPEREDRPDHDEEDSSTDTHLCVLPLADGAAESGGDPRCPHVEPARRRRRGGGRGQAARPSRVGRRSPARRSTGAAARPTSSAADAAAATTTNPARGPWASIIVPETEAPKETPMPIAAPSQVKPSVIRRGGAMSWTKELPLTIVGAMAKPARKPTTASSGTERTASSAAVPAARRAVPPTSRSHSGLAHCRAP